MWAKGKKAYGECDRCGQRYDLKNLYYEYYHGRRNGLRVCRACLDEDHPQLFADEYSRVENIALDDPRPLKDLDTTRGLFGWNEPGQGTRQQMSSKVRVKLGQAHTNIT